MIYYDDRWRIYGKTPTRKTRYGVSNFGMFLFESMTAERHH